MRIYGVIGWKNAGKTGLMERLVAEIRARGFTVSTISDSVTCRAPHSIATVPGLGVVVLARDGVYALTGGWKAWIEADYPTEKKS